MITIVDYDAGNVRSVANMLRSIGVDSRISSDPSEILGAERLILPGVGQFDHGMRALERRGLIDALTRRVIEGGAPLLGICLGAQLLTSSSEEGELPGLGWFDAKTVKFDRSIMPRSLKVPHMGWADTWLLQDHDLFMDLPPAARFYYVHSYHFTCESPSQSVLATRHGYEFVSGIAQRNIVGVQFHPEKSHRFGMQVLKNFSNWVPDALEAVL